MSIRQLLVVALVIGIAFVASEFIGSVLERRAIALRAVQEQEKPALAATPSGRDPTAETRP